MAVTFHLKCMILHVLFCCLGLCYIIFLLPDSGGCARKRAAMSVTLTSVKRVQSSPNLLAAGITSLPHSIVTLEWLYLTSLSFQNYLVWMSMVAINTFQMPTRSYFSLPKNSLYPFCFVLKIKSQRKLIACKK